MVSHVRPLQCPYLARLSAGVSLLYNPGVPLPLRQLFEAHVGCSPFRIERLKSEASDRKPYRLSTQDGRSLVGVVGPDAGENRAFLSFTRTFTKLELPVPRLLAESDDGLTYLLEDLGNRTLNAELQQARRATGERWPTSVRPAFRAAMALLPRFQVEGGRHIDFRDAYPRARQDRRAFLWDLNYFKYHFLKLAHAPFQEDRLEDDFETLLERLPANEDEHFLYRDFQPRNVMWKDDAPRYLDYQGGRRGPLAYDVASMLYSGSAGLDEDARAELLAVYLEAVQAYVPVDEPAFCRELETLAVLRILQALGTYGYRGFHERKQGFASRVPTALDNLAGLADRGALEGCTELERVLSALREDDARWAEPTAAAEDRLRVRIGSFSYRGGFPRDVDEHGGGFVFDCRALVNPGRDEAYRGLSGLDEAVRTILAADPQVEAFFRRTASLVESHVEDFVVRGFHALDVRYGCTGGQHRSTYLAERLAAHLRALHPGIEVVVGHAEAPRWPETATQPTVAEDEAV